MHLPRASLPTPRHFALSFAALSLVPLAASAAQAAPPPSLDAAIRSPGGGTSEAPVAPASDEASRPIGFSADSVTYDDRADTVTATGDVFLRRDDQSVRADSVTWSRTTGAIVATGHVRMVDANGNETFVHKVSLTDRFAAGTMDDILLVLREGGRAEPFNYTVPYPDPYVPRSLTWEIPGRLRPDERLTCQARLPAGEVLARVPEAAKLPHVAYLG